MLCLDNTFSCEFVDITLIIVDKKIVEAQDHKELTKLILLFWSVGLRDSCSALIEDCASSLKNYFSISWRSQRVLWNNELSDQIQNLHGTPQGSLLGRVLFFTYINDLEADKIDCGDLLDSYWQMVQTNYFVLYYYGIYLEWRII